MTTVTIPYKPRSPQTALHGALDRYRWVVAVCHRRMGKTVAACNHLIRAALTSTKARPRFAYLAPTYRQGKATCWDYLKHYATVVPGVQVNESELRVDFPTGGQVRIYGADNPDALRGIYLDGVVLDEFGLMDPTVFSEVIRPLLADRQGWALFIGTPNGRNQFYDAVIMAQRLPDWTCLVFKASDTQILPDEELQAARAVMTADEYAQEFECSFEAAVKGAIYAVELASVREAGRVTRVPYEPALPVNTDWDLGIGDSTAIWLSQSLYSGEVRLIGYLHGSGQGLPAYAQRLQALPYAYGVHYMPHDVRVREFTTGVERLTVARQLLGNVQVTPKLPLDDGISAVRLLFPRCWFDAERCQEGLEALQHYTWDYNTRIHEFKPLPLHNWASHGADAFRGLAARHYTPKAPRVVTQAIDTYERWERQRVAPRHVTVDAGGVRGGW